jgi:hypothetical protein
VGKKDGGKLILGAEEGKSAKLKRDISPFLENRGVEYVEGIYGTSDHVSFSVLGYDAITLGQENIFTGNGAIHTPGDKIDNIDYDYLHKLSSAVYDFILSKR